MMKYNKLLRLLILPFCCVIGLFLYDYRLFIYFFDEFENFWKIYQGSSSLSESEVTEENLPREVNEIPQKIESEKSEENPNKKLSTLKRYAPQIILGILAAVAITTVVYLYLNSGNSGGSSSSSDTSLSPSPETIYIESPKSSGSSEKEILDFYSFSLPEDRDPDRFLNDAQETSLFLDNTQDPPIEPFNLNNPPTMIHGEVDREPLREPSVFQSLETYLNNLPLPDSSDSDTSSESEPIRFPITRPILGTHVSVQAAINHLRTLPLDSKEAAIAYFYLKEEVRRYYSLSENNFELERKGNHVILDGFE